MFILLILLAIVLTLLVVMKLLWDTNKRVEFLEDKCTYFDAYLVTKMQDSMGVSTSGLEGNGPGGMNGNN